MRNKMGSIIGGIIVILLGIGMAVGGVFISLENKEISEKGVATDAQIIKRDEHIEHHTRTRKRHANETYSDRQETKITYYFILRFVDPANVAYEVQRNVSRPLWDKHKVGDTVPIKYMADHPKKLRLASELEGDQMGPAYGLGIAGAVIALIGIGITIWAIRARG